MPSELFEEEGKGFISKVEDGWEETMGEASHLDQKKIFEKGAKFRLSTSKKRPSSH